MNVNDWMEKINAERERIAARLAAGTILSDLVAARCRCGALAMHSPRSPIQALCSECRHEDANAGRASLPSGFMEAPVADALACYPLGADWEQVKIMENADGNPVRYYQNNWEDYWKQYLELVAGKEPYPQPAQTSREPMTMQPPTSVLQLAEHAREEGWEVRMQYAQGYPPHGSTGRPGALKDSIAVVFGNHPLTPRRAYACYEKTASAKTWAWSGILIWGPDLPPYAGCGLAELKEFLDMPIAAADLLHAWVNAIKAKNAERAEATRTRAKERAKTAMPKAREGMS